MPEYKSPLNKVGLKCINAPGLGEKISASYGVSSVIVIPPGATTYETCGHTGCNIDIEYPTDVTEEIVQAFQNVENALVEAGVKEGWQAVYRMTTYHVGRIEEQEAGLEKAMGKFLGENRPAWVGVSVSTLSGPARIEITVTAAVVHEK